MILPIYGFGHAVLKKTSDPIEPNYPDLDQLIDNMYETMYAAHGVGLAAPQVGIPIRLFVVDTTQVLDEEENEVKGIKKVFINAQMLDEQGELWSYEEGCLSIPEIRGDIDRKPDISLSYLDENFEPHKETFNGINARVIQHEYDHIEGVLFVEKLKPVKKALIRRKLDNIRKGAVKVDYRMKFALNK